MVKSIDLSHWRVTNFLWKRVFKRVFTEWDTFDIANYKSRSCFFKSTVTIPTVLAHFSFGFLVDSKIFYSNLELST